MGNVMTGSTQDAGSAIDAVSRSLALEDFKGVHGSNARTFVRDPIWAAFRDLGSMLWLDTGDLEEAAKNWTCEFTHLTTNNTLVNKQVQSGQFDSLIPEAARQLRAVNPRISDSDLVHEIGFILNCRVALRLVEAFDAHVSVELHPDVAHDVDATVQLAHRYHRVCSERFIIKVPLTAAGYLSVRRLAAEGLPINYTLGFSARQNYLALILSQPRYVNVFMGRLNAFVADNHLGDGKYVGEKATLATQLALWHYRDQGNRTPTRLIGASTREAQQVIDLAGLDVFTLPPAVAAAVHSRMEGSRVRLSCCAERKFEVKLTPPFTAEAVGLSVLWELPDRYCRMVKRLNVEAEVPATPAALSEFLDANGCSNLFRQWTDAELEEIRQDGKIPRYDRWKEGLKSGEIALDDLMSVSALGSFAHDQGELDGRIRRLMQPGAPGQEGPR